MKINIPLMALYKAEVHDRTEEIDPDLMQDFFSLSLGWAIAKGLSISDAQEFALQVQYNTDMG